MSLFSELKRRNVLRVAAAYLVVGWLLTEVLTTILPTFGAPDWIAKAVILSFAFGFIPAVVLSWIYELTPDGIRKELGAGKGEAGDIVSLGKLDYLAIAGVVFAVIFVAFLSASRSPDDSSTELATISDKSVAVLPFVNMSKDADNDYFSDGLTETLLHMLAQVPDLKVAARTSSFAFKGKNMDIRQIAEALQVAHVLEGSIQQSGTRIRITAQLIRAADGYHVWSENYDRDSDDIFGIQDEIAAMVGRSLTASLLGADDSTLVAGIGTEDVDAYDLYLQALKHRTTFSYSGLAAAEKLLKGALLIDSGFLDAKTELASNYLYQLETGLMDQDDALASVLAITEQVLQASPDDVSARAIYVYAQAAQRAAEGGGEFVATAIEELESIVESSPRDYQARFLLSKMLRDTQRAAEALQLQKDALGQDPYNARILFELGALYLELDELEKSSAALRASLEIEPQQPNAYLRLAEIALKSGDGVNYFQQSLWAMEVDASDHEIPGMIAEFLYQLGLNEEADDFRDRVLAIAPTSGAAYRIDLLRAISANDEPASVAAARRTIESGVDQRRFAFGGAVQYLLRTAARNGTVAAESAYLEQQSPGILDIYADVIPARYMTAQRLAFDAWYKTLSSDELLRRMTRIQEIAASYGFDLLQNPVARVNMMAMQGDVEGAIDVALSEVFSQSVLTDLDWRSRYSQAQYVDMTADPRVQVALQRWEAEEATVRQSVLNFLLDLSSASSDEKRT